MTVPEDNAQLTAAAAPLKLKDKEFQASPLTDRDHSELDRWCGMRMIRIAREACVGMTESEAAPVLSAAVREASNAAWMSDRGQKVFGTFEGISRLGYQLIKAKHPQVTYDYVRSLVTTRFEVDEINQVFALLHPVKKGPNKNPPPSQK